MLTISTLAKSYSKITVSICSIWKFAITIKFNLCLSAIKDLEWWWQLKCNIWNLKLLSLAKCYPASGTQFTTSKHLLIINLLLGSPITDKGSLEFKVQNSKKDCKVLWSHVFVKKIVGLHFYISLKFFDKQIRQDHFTCNLRPLAFESLFSVNRRI